MKRLFIGLISLVLILIVSLVIWTHLPLQIQRSSDIQKGDIIVKHLTQYKDIHGRFPDTGDWKTLQGIGFSINEIGTQPDYKKVSDTSYVLTFLEGFDGPYLTYDMKSKTWVMK